MDRERYRLFMSFDKAQHESKLYFELVFSRVTLVVALGGSILAVVFFSFFFSRRFVDLCGHPRPALIS